MDNTPSPSERELLVQARDALITARNGLYWYQDLCPESVDRSDAEADEEIISAHRAMLEAILDAVFPFDEAGHLCHNPLCINPDHLEVQTQTFNLGERRGYRAPQGSMIPALFPREDAFDDFLEKVVASWCTEEVALAA